jgi:hypothetical protein
MADALTSMAPESLRLNWVERPRAPRAPRAPRVWPVVTPFRVIAGGTCMFALAMVFASPRGQSVQPPRAPPTKFDQTWEDAAVGAAARKSDLQPTVRTIQIVKPEFQQASFDAKPVKTERMMPETPAKMPPLVRVEAVDEVRPRRRFAERGDVCSRHGMRKAMVGKYRWRCRK